MFSRITRFKPLAFLKTAAADKRGVSAVAVAITMAVMTPMALGIVDVFTMSEQRGKLQDALDAATLYAARSTASTTPAIDAIGDQATQPSPFSCNAGTISSSISRTTRLY